MKNAPVPRAWDPAHDAEIGLETAPAGRMRFATGCSGLARARGYVSAMRLAMARTGAIASTMATASIQRSAAAQSSAV